MLKLDWTLSSKEDRLNFVRDYIKEKQFSTDELDMIGKYILWGKSSELSPQQQARADGLILDSAWSPPQVESLEALLTAPGFSETQIRQPDAPVYKVPKTNFSRAVARTQAPANLLPELELLWTKIDELDFMCSTYELSHGRRTAPIRQTLLNRLSEERKTNLTQKVHKLTPYSYLSLKRRLVELRREQYFYKDYYAPTTTLNEIKRDIPIPRLPLVWDVDVRILPMGLPYDTPLCKVLFGENFPSPADLTPDLEGPLTELLWKERTPPAYTLDLRQPAHLTPILDHLYFCTENPAPNIYSTFNLLYNLVMYYIKIADLKDFHRVILDLKMRHYTNIQICEELRKRYSRNYSVNYISTLFHQTIIPSICHAAQRHREVCENLFFPENFKKCIDCGRILLRDSENFMRKSKVKDGFDCRCKVCAKIKRRT